MFISSQFTFLFTISDIFIEKTQTKIKANEEREYILNTKAQMLETKIQETEDMLTNVGNITPVEVDEHCNSKHITVLFFFQCLHFFLIIFISFRKC